MLNANVNLRPGDHSGSRCHSGALYCTVLYCTVLYCTAVLYCTQNTVHFIDREKFDIGHSETLTALSSHAPKLCFY